MSARFTRFKPMFVENRVMKISALILAIITVYAIQRITNQLEDFEVPIIVEVEEGVAVLKQDAKTAYITCRGSKDDLERLDVRQLEVVVSPKETGVAGGERVPIGPRNVHGWMRGVQVIKVRPGVVAVNFDREIEKQVGVAQPETAGKPLLGKAEVDFEPKVVTIRGPQSKLVDLKILRTEPIDVDGAVDSFDRRLKILTQGEAGVWEVEPSEVIVHVNIVTEAISKEWKDMKVLAMLDAQCGKDFAFSPPLVSVSLLGSPRAVNRIKAEDISVFVDCVDLSEPGTHKIPAAVHLPPGINVTAAVDPPVVEVTVKPTPSSEAAPAAEPSAEDNRPDTEPEN